MKACLVLDYSEKLCEKQKKVFEVLVCPIISTKNINSIEKFHSDNRTVIISGHEICRQGLIDAPDEDMCDLAICFYEILYGVEEGSIIKQPGKPKEWDYAGDTMNSFEYVTKYSSIIKKNEWNEIYHCLANFWMIPGNIGRQTNRNSKNSGGVFSKQITVESFNKGRRDYMDRFLCKKNNLAKFSKKGHYIDGVYIKNGVVDMFSYLEETDEDFSSKVDGIINKMMDKICERAVAIVNDKVMCDKLFDYFYSLNLMK